MSAKRAKKTSPKPPKTASMDKFGVWKAKAALYAEKHPSLRLNDILAEDDPYDLAEAMPAAFEAGQSPEDFIEEVFQEDIVSREYDEHLAEEAYEHELGELGQPDDQEPGGAEITQLGRSEITELGRSDLDDVCHFPPRLGCKTCAARLVAPRTRDFVLVHDPKATKTSFWTGTRWTKSPDKAKVYRNHDGETTTAAVRKRGFSKAALMPQVKAGVRGS